MTVIVLAQFKAKQDRLDAVLNHVRALKKHADDHEEGTLSYEPAQDPEDPTKISIWEEYTNDETWKGHETHPPFQAFKNELPDLLEGDLSIKRLNRIK